MTLAKRSATLRLMSEVKKVAHVMRRFTVDKWGGTESVVLNLSRQLIKTGIQSPIFCTDMFAKPGLEEIDSVPVRRFRYVFPWLGLNQEAKEKLKLKGGSPLSLCLFFRLLFEKDLSLIHTHVQHRLGGIARTVAKLRGIPYIVSIHGGYLTIPKATWQAMEDPFRGKLEWGKAFGFLFGSRKCLQDAAAVICVGENEYREMKQQFPDKKVCYIPNGVNVAPFRDADPDVFRHAYKIGPGEKLVLCLSRIDYQKNQLLLVNSFAAFAKSHPDYKLVLVGPVCVESYYKDIQNAIAQHGLQDRTLIIPGFQPDDPMLYSAYKAADMFVLPSSHEPFGIVILEAWAAGTPVIASKVGGIPGFTSHETNVLLFENNNGVMLTEQMTRLASAATLQQTLRANGAKEVSEKYDWPVIAERYKQLYRSL